MTDTWANGKQHRIFESGAILEYLVERYDKENRFSYPKDSPEYWEVKSWVCLGMICPKLQWLTVV